MLWPGESTHTFNPMHIFLLCIFHFGWALGRSEDTTFVQPIENDFRVDVHNLPEKI